MAQSLAALRLAGRQGARQFLFKYCSTFDSTDEGNIGPVADALLDALGADFTIACPAFPETGRTIFKGHLFVGDLLLSDTHMRHHPLTPMTDANLVRVLGGRRGARSGWCRSTRCAAGPRRSASGSPRCGRRVAPTRSPTRSRTRTFAGSGRPARTWP